MAVTGPRDVQPSCLDVALMHYHTVKMREINDTAARLLEVASTAATTSTIYSSSRRWRQRPASGAPTRTPS